MHRSILSRFGDSLLLRSNDETIERLLCSLFLVVLLLSFLGLDPHLNDGQVDSAGRLLEYKGG